MTEDIWREKSDEELITASAHLSDYTEEAEGMIRAELRRRSIPEPQPTMRARVDVQSKRSRSSGFMLACVLVLIVIAGAVWFYSSPRIDASAIDDMVESIDVKARKYVKDGNIAMVEYYLFVMNGLKLEKKLILTSPEERSQKDIDAVYQTIHRSDYEKTLREVLSQTQYEQLQRLRKEYKYIKD